MRKKIILLTVSFIGLLIFKSFTSTNYVVDKGENNLSIQNDEWKNLKILPKDISKEELNKIMNNFNEALGVKCGFCHEFDSKTNKLDFASEAKEEIEYTRHMITMTKEINRQYFGWQNKENPDEVNAVTCYSCHNGRAKIAKNLAEANNFDKMIKKANKKSEKTAK